MEMRPNEANGDTEANKKMKKDMIRKPKKKNLHLFSARAKKRDLRKNHSSNKSLINCEVTTTISIEFSKIRYNNAERKSYGVCIKKGNLRIRGKLIAHSENKVFTRCRYCWIERWKTKEIA